LLLTFKGWCRRGDVSGFPRYAACMRYPQGGGLTDERRAFRERLRIKAAERFRHGDRT
jgi:hypothetical protein